MTSDATGRWTPACAETAADPKRRNRARKAHAKTRTRLLSGRDGSYHNDTTRTPSRSPATSSTSTFPRVAHLGSVAGCSIPKIANSGEHADVCGRSVVGTRPSTRPDDQQDRDRAKSGPTAPELEKPDRVGSSTLKSTTRALRPKRSPAPSRCRNRQAAKRHRDQRCDQYRNASAGEPKPTASARSQARPPRQRGRRGHDRFLAFTSNTKPQKTASLSENAPPDVLTCRDTSQGASTLCPRRRNPIDEIEREQGKED